MEELAGMPEVGPLLRRAAVAAVFRRGTRVVAGESPELVVRGSVVDRERLRQYEKVCCFAGGELLPPTYPHVLAFPIALEVMSRPSFPFPMVGLVHIANRIEVLRPIHVGERLDLRVRSGNIRDHERGTTVDLITAVAAGGADVWRESSTYLRRRGGARGRGERVPVPEMQQEWTVTASVASAYARVSADRNPIHTSRVAARLFGFPRCIAHGMWTLARCLASLDPPGSEYTVDAAFKLPILLPATVGFATDGRQFAVHDVPTGRPHLAGMLG